MFESIKFEPIKKEFNKVSFFNYTLFLNSGKVFLSDGSSIQEIENYHADFLLKLEEKKEEAEICGISKHKDTLTRMSFFYPEGGKGGIRMDSYTLSIGFELSDSISVDSFEDDFIIMDSKRKRYVMFFSMKKKYGASIDVESFSTVRMFAKNSAFIITDKGINVIINGERSVISKDKLGIDLLSLDKWAVVNDRGKDYLLISSKDRVIVVSLSGDDKFYFGVFNKEPFEKFKLKIED